MGVSDRHQVRAWEGDIRLRLREAERSFADVGLPLPWKMRRHIVKDALLAKLEIALASLPQHYKRRTDALAKQVGLIAAPPVWLFLRVRALLRRRSC